MLDSSNCPDCKGLKRVCKTCGVGMPQESQVQQTILKRVETSNTRFESPSIKEPIEKKSHTCTECGGRGYKNGGKRKCKVCDGEGTLYLVDCVDCKGSGKKGRLRCPTCKGNGVVSSVENNRILKLQKKCSNLLHNPLKELALPLLAIVATAASTYFASGYIYVDFDFFGTGAAYIPLIIAFGAVSYVVKNCQTLFEAAELDPQKGTVKAIGVATVVVLLVAGFIAAVSGRFSMLERNAIDALNENSNGLVCTKLKVTHEQKNPDYSSRPKVRKSSFYDGIAYFSDGSSKNVTVLYEQTYYRYRRKSSTIRYRVLVNVK